MSPDQMKQKCKAIKLFITDVDGVLTDGGMYYGEQGDELKKFNVRDGVGVALFRQVGIDVAIITGEKTELVVRRAKKLGITLCFTGIHDKAAILEKILADHGLQKEEIAYIGDEINDASLLGKVGLFFTVEDANPFIKDRADMVLAVAGGSGALREAAHFLLANRNELELAIESFCRN